MFSPNYPSPPTFQPTSPFYQSALDEYSGSPNDEHLVNLGIQASRLEMLNKYNVTTKRCKNAQTLLREPWGSIDEKLKMEHDGYCFDAAELVHLFFENNGVMANPYTGKPFPNDFMKIAFLKVRVQLTRPMTDFLWKHYMEDNDPIRTERQNIKAQYKARQEVCAIAYGAGTESYRKCIENSQEYADDLIFKTIFAKYDAMQTRILFEKIAKLNPTTQAEVFKLVRRRRDMG